jgi:hypothetical protein
VVSARPTRGISALETTVALAVVTILAASALDGGSIPAEVAGASLRRLEEGRAAASALERLDRAKVAAGARDFETGLLGATGRLDVHEVEPGLFEATATVATEGRPPTTRTTRLLREERR